LKSHYAPGKPLIVGDVDAIIDSNPGKKIAVISYNRKYDVFLNKVLSPTGNLHEAASNLFTALRELDRSEAEIILAEKFPDEGMGMAINDRLSRAAVSSSPL
jgi:L-threonylcarbamoyladenylate synthase